MGEPRSNIGPWLFAAIVIGAVAIAAAIYFSGRQPRDEPLSQAATPPPSATPSQDPQGDTATEEDSLYQQTLDDDVMHLCTDLGSLESLLAATRPAGGRLVGDATGWRDIEAFLGIDAEVFAGLIGEPSLEGQSVGTLSTSTRILSIRTGQVALAIERGSGFPVAPGRVLSNVTEISGPLASQAGC